MGQGLRGAAGHVRRRLRHPGGRHRLHGHRLRRRHRSRRGRVLHVPGEGPATPGAEPDLQHLDHPSPRRERRERLRSTPGGTPETEPAEEEDLTYALSTHDTDVVLVKNTGQAQTATTHGLFGGTPRFAQGFTTGTDTDGYTLGSIGFYFADIDRTSTAGAHLKVTLNADSSGDPGSALCTLTDPGSFTANAVNTFDVPATCPTLAANRTYFAVIERVTINSDAIFLSATASSNEDTGGSAGWSIENDRKTYASGAWGDDSDSLLIVVRGSVTTAPPLAVFDPNLHDVGSTYLVKNTERIEGLAGSSLDNTNTKLAQQFTTGPSADGYHARLDSRTVLGNR